MSGESSWAAGRWILLGLLMPILAIVLFLWTILRVSVDPSVWTAIVLVDYWAAFVVLAILVSDLTYRETPAEVWRYGPRAKGLFR